MAYSTDIKKWVQHPLTNCLTLKSIASTLLLGGATIGAAFLIVLPSPYNSKYSGQSWISGNTAISRHTNPSYRPKIPWKRRFRIKNESLGSIANCGYKVLASQVLMVIVVNGIHQEQNLQRDIRAPCWRIILIEGVHRIWR